MITILQENLADNIIKNATRKKKRNKQELLETSGYSPTSAKSSAQTILNQEGVKKALEVRGFTVENAKKVVTQILLNEDYQPQVRLSAAREIFAVEGSYSPTKQINMNVDVNELEQTIREQTNRVRSINT